MPTPPSLLNDDGSASMATALMMSHHALRRDIEQFAAALHRVDERRGPDLEALREEWRSFGEKLHGHHVDEDTHVFPEVLGKDGGLGPTIDRLIADHRLIDPVLEEGDSAFAALPEVERATAVVVELRTLLDAHLATEEAEVIPFLRDEKEFPAPADDAEADLFAEGFAWSSHGVATDVLEKVYAMVPEIITSRLADARNSYETRCVQVWGSADAGASRTSVPDRSG
jgi:hypothetical protein